MTRPPRTFARFLVVGSAGFVIDAGALWLLVWMGGDAYVMRVLSFLMAMSATWALNRRWTFQALRRGAIHREYAAYAFVQATGTAINFGVYALVLSIIGTGPTSAVLALACGSVVALFANFLGMKHVVFRTAES